MLDDLFVFAAVVERGSLNKAAQTLNISQPALSRRIGKLEERLGFELFHRQGKKLKLTRLGRICYEYAQELRERHEKFRQTVADYQGHGTKSITVGASLTTLQTTFPDLIAFLLEDQPGLDIKAITGKTHEILEDVIDKKVDFALVASEVNHPEIHCIPLFEDHLALVVPRKHGLLRVKEVRIGELNQLPMILFSRGSWYRVLLEQWFAKHEIYPEIRMEIDSFEAIVRLSATCGIAALLPQSYLRESILEDNGLTAVRIHELEQTTRTTSLIYSRSKSPHEFVGETVRKASAHFREHFNRSQPFQTAQSVGSFQSRP